MLINTTNIILMVVLVRGQRAASFENHECLTSIGIPSDAQLAWLKKHNHTRMDEFNLLHLHVDRLAA